MSDQDTQITLRAGYEAEILSHLNSGTMNIQRNEVQVMNPSRFRANTDDTDDIVKAASLLAQIYTAPLDSQPDLAKQLVKGQDKVALYMWYETVFSGHALVRKAIEESGEVALQGSDIQAQFNDAGRAYRKEQMQLVLQASADEKAEAAQKWLENFAGEESQLLFDAAVNGDENLVSYLLMKGVAPHADNEPSLMPLHAACHKGHLGCAKLLHDAGIRINHVDEFGGTPLMRAAVGGQEDIARWLLHHGANAHLRESREGNYGALEYGAGLSFAITEMLLDAGCEFSFDALAAAASHGNDKSFDLLFAQRFGVQISDSLGVHRPDFLKALSMSGVGGSVHIIESIIKCLTGPKDEQETLEAGPDLKDSLQQAALLAVSQNHSEAADYLLSILQSYFGHEPSPDFISSLLVDAAGAGSVPCVRLLIERYGADVDYLRKPDLSSPLYNAVKAGDAAMVRSLVEDYKADIQQANGKYANGPTALWLAVHLQDETTARTLLELGGPVEYLGPAIGADTMRVYVVAEREYRAPVRLLEGMDPAWNKQESSERFLCLEYPDGFRYEVQMRKADVDLKDGRELRPAPGAQMRERSWTGSLWLRRLSDMFGL